MHEQNILSNTGLVQSAFGKHTARMCVEGGNLRGSKSSEWAPSSARKQSKDFFFPPSRYVGRMPPPDTSHFDAVGRPHTNCGKDPTLRSDDTVRRLILTPNPDLTLALRALRPVNQSISNDVLENTVTLRCLTSWISTSSCGAQDACGSIVRVQLWCCFL